MFPLNGKLPFAGSHGHFDATTDLEAVGRAFAASANANVAIALRPSGLVVIDVDGEEGEEGLREILGENPPTTRVVETGRGRHYYFSAPKEVTLGRKCRLRKDLDLLGDGYVVAPPSVHPETKRGYVVVTDAAIAPLPKQLVTAYLDGKGRERGAIPITGHHPTRLRNRRIEAYINKLPTGLHDGEGRNATAYTLAAWLTHDAGLPPDAALGWMVAWNERQAEPYPTDRLNELLRNGHRYGSHPITSAETEPEHLTDLGNAQRLVRHHRGTLKYVRALRRWLAWDGRRWAGDDTGEAERCAKETVRAIYNEVAAETNSERRVALTKHATRSESTAAIHAMLELAGTDPEIAARPGMFDTNPWALNVLNGVLDLRTGDLRPHDPEEYHSKLAPVEYDPDAKAPRWNQFLERILPDDDGALIRYVQRAVGYCLTGDTSEQSFFLLYGRGANGKTTFLETLRLLLGDYAQQADFSTFLSWRTAGPRNDLARLHDTRLVTAAEAPGGQPFDEALLKLLTGGDVIAARFLYRETFEFRPSLKLILAANHRPPVREQSAAFWRRVRLIPFTQQIPPEQQDKMLLQKFEEERSGILNWGLAGCKGWQQVGLQEPPAVREAIEDYRQENDLVGDFIVGCCITGSQMWSSTASLYQEFLSWFEQTQGNRTMPPTQARFGRLLGERTELEEEKRRGTRGWRGIGLPPPG